MKEQETQEQEQVVQEQAVQEQGIQEQGSTSDDFGQILAEFEQKDSEETRKVPAVGEKVKGTILSIGDAVAFVDLGGKSEGQIDLTQLRDSEGNLTVNVGDTLEATVTGTDPETGSLVLRRKVARGQEVAAELRQALETGIPVEGVVTAINKGGAEVQVSGMRAFCPLSQLDLRYVEDPQQFVNQRLSFRVMRIEPGKTRPNIVLSRRALLEEEAEAKAAETKEKLQVGAVLRGKVTSLASYGAFVDLGGLEGMLHVSEIGYSRLAHPNEVLQVGQEVEVQVIKIEKGKDEKRPRISLSRRALEQDPWKDVAERFSEGTEMTGRVMRTESFGAFVEIAPGVEGLVHISEMGSGRRLNHAREAVQLGQDVKVRVLGVDPAKRRISLSMGSGAEGGGGGRDSRDRDRDHSRSERGGGGRGRDRDRDRGRDEDYEAYVAKSTGSGSGFGSMADFFKNVKRK